MIKKKTLKLILLVCVSLYLRRKQSPATHDLPFYKLIGDTGDRSGLGVMVRVGLGLGLELKFGFGLA